MTCAEGVGRGSRRRLRQPRSPTGKDGREWEYLLVLTLAVFRSPLSWSHYYVLLLLPMAFLFLLASQASPGYDG